MSVTAGVSDTIIAIREKLRGKIGQTKVKRYWPGKAPEWADEPEEDSDLPRAHTLDLAFPKHDAASLSRAALDDDPRLRRLAVNKAEDKEEARADHRRIRQAEIISRVEEDEDEDEEEDEDLIEERRRRIRERLLEKRVEEERELGGDVADDDDDVEDDVEGESEEESEYETDSEEDEEVERRAMAKPVFVPKKERETIAERERLEAEERELEEKVRRKLEERKAETKRIVVEKIREDEELGSGGGEGGEGADVADVDTDDELNEAEEYEGWKSREIARIKRDREDREAMVKEREEIERVRNMSEEERREWERKNPKEGTPTRTNNKQKWRFMQKYYHKGAFFQSDADDRAGTAGSDEIFRRDFSAPTGEDKLDKSILPKVMQVKHFGRSGRTKWTHLVNEDTTVWGEENPYVSLFDFVFLI